MTDKPTKADVIAHQAKQIYRMKKRLKEIEKAIKTTRNMMTAIGAPLNDNVLAFNNEQIKYISRLYKELDA